MRFTPGPWSIKRSPGLHDGAHDYAISADGATVLSEAFGRGALGEWLPAEANARLIAAAPQMFEALLQAREWLRGWASAEPQLAVIEAALSAAHPLPSMEGPSNG